MSPPPRPQPPPSSATVGTVGEEGEGGAQNSSRRGGIGTPIASAVRLIVCRTTDDIVRLSDETTAVLEHSCLLI